tara:strand:- start:609 stop:1028 length:420 start_codon:yes stop_codon:yes gene_type:complete
MPSKSLNDTHKTEDVMNTRKVRRVRHYYPSNMMGRRIINAVTGSEYPWAVGSKQSKLLFCVHDSSGMCDKNGYLVTRTNCKEPNSVNPADEKKLVSSRNPNKCYYESPNEYMLHRNVKLSRAFIEDWKAKNAELRAQLC